MSDASEGPGWWQASDGKWYPPEQAPGGGPVPGAGALPVEIGSAFSYGWNKFIANIGDIALIWLIVIAVNIFFNVLGQASQSLFLSLFLALLAFVASMVVQIALIRVGLLVTTGQRPELSKAFDTTNLGPFLVASLLFAVGVFLGAIILCIGALVVGLLFWFYGYFVLDQNQDPVTSLKSSFQLTTQNFGTVGVFALLAVLLTICTCGLASPVVQISAAYVYRRLNGQEVAA